MSEPIQILSCGPQGPDLATSVWGPFTVHACETLVQTAQALRHQSFDAVLIDAGALASIDELLHYRQHLLAL
jgi:hypothetical protein